jgi:hypothetical protein
LKLVAVSQRVARDAALGTPTPLLAGAMWRIYGGAVMVIAGIAALIVAGSHHPEAHHPPVDFGGKNVLGILILTRPGSGWSQTAYDLVRIGGWALLILGGVTAIVGLIRCRQRPRRAP